MSGRCPAGGPVCPRSICDCFIDEFPDDLSKAGELHPEFYAIGEGGEQS